MKALAALLVLFSASFLSFSQKTVTVNNKRNAYLEQYTVLASNKEIKHGGYIKFWKQATGNKYALEMTGSFVNNVKQGYWEYYYGGSEHPFSPLNNNIKKKGFHKNGAMDSIWVFFYPENIPHVLEEMQEADGSKYLRIPGASPVVQKSGFYRNGVPAKEWKYYDLRGEHVHTYDFDLKQLTYSQGCDLRNCESDFLGRTAEHQLNEAFDMKNLMFSIHNYQALKTSELTFDFTIDEKGQIQNIIQKEGTLTNKKIIDQAILAIRSLSSIALPKMVDGQPQSSTRSVKVKMEVGRNVKVSGNPNSTFVSKSQQTVISFKVL
jgi:antitoxin component YwqK of YwqJK toxin-antitoxin module